MLLKAADNTPWWGNREVLTFLAVCVVALVFFRFAPLILGGYCLWKWGRRKVKTSVYFVIFFVGLITAEAVWAAILPPPKETSKQDTPQETVLSADQQEESTPDSREVVSEATPNREAVTVVRVIDGDTVEITGGQRVRYIGIDTPETVHPSEPVGCYGSEASAKNKELVEGKTVELEKDVSETDQYRRLLRYVWLGDLLVNEYLVREGYAQASSYPPDVKYQDRFTEAQRLAREEGKGLWSSYCATWGEAQTATPPLSDDTSTNASTCDCSKTCYQISSCEEAYYQLNDCGCSVRDGDGDGVPCENLCGGGQEQVESQPAETQTPNDGGGSESSYSCNCSKTCPNMSSCEEAYYQLNVCGCSRRDGDKDGVPCESICN